MDGALSAASRVKRCHGESDAILNLGTLDSVAFAAFKGRRPPVLVMATPLALTPASGAPTPTSANASGPLASLLASAEKFASPGVSADERYRVVCEIREIASDLAISHEYPNFLSRFVPLFDDFLHKEVMSVFPCLPAPLAELYSR